MTNLDPSRYARDDVVSRREHAEVIRLVATERNEALAEVERLRQAIRAVGEARRAYVEDRACEADVDVALDVLADHLRGKRSTA